MDHKGFEQVLKRYQNGQANSEETRAVEQWLAHKEESGTFSSLSLKKREAIKGRLFFGIDAQIGHRSHRMPKLFLQIAVGLLLFAGAWLVSLHYTDGGAYITVDNPDKAIRKVHLSDGSIVWLKGHSSITYPSSFSGNERRVQFYGEGLFEIAKVETQPNAWAKLLGEKQQRMAFVVECGETTTRVLGTSFNIKSDSSSTEVFVLTGKVVVRSADNQEVVELLPKEMVVYDHKVNAFQKSVAALPSPKKPHAETGQQRIAELTVGTEHDMYFDRASMAEVAQRIEKKFNQKVILSERLRNCEIRADLTDQSLESTLAIIADVLEARYQITDGILYIQGNGCP